MVQLVGYYMWQSSQRRMSDVITAEDVEQGTVDAVRAFQYAVCAPALDGLSMPQREFLRAMQPDLPGPTHVSDIPRRTGKSTSWANKYRASLIADQVIAAEGKGLVRLAISTWETTCGRWIRGWGFRQPRVAPSLDAAGIPATQGRPAPKGYHLRDRGQVPGRGSRRTNPRRCERF